MVNPALAINPPTEASKVGSKLVPTPMPIPATPATGTPPALMVCWRRAMMNCKIMTAEERLGMSEAGTAGGEGRDGVPPLGSPVDVVGTSLVDDEGMGKAGVGIPGGTGSEGTGSEGTETGSPGAGTGSPGAGTGSPGAGTGSPGAETGSPGAGTGSPGAGTGSPGAAGIGSEGAATGSPGAGSGSAGPAAMGFALVKATNEHAMNDSNIV